MLLLLQAPDWTSSAKEIPILPLLARVLLRSLGPLEGEARGGDEERGGEEDKGGVDSSISVGTGVSNGAPVDDGGKEDFQISTRRAIAR